MVKHLKLPPVAGGKRKSNEIDTHSRRCATASGGEEFSELPATETGSLGMREWHKQGPIWHKPPMEGEP